MAVISISIRSQRRLRFPEKVLIQSRKEEVFIEKETQLPTQVVLKEALVEQEMTLVASFFEGNYRSNLKII